MAQAPSYGPHDPELTIGEFLRATYGRLYAGNEAKMSNIPVMEAKFKDVGAIFDVSDLMTATKSLRSAALREALSAIEVEAVSNLINKYLGVRGQPFVPPLEGGYCPALVVDSNDLTCSLLCLLAWPAKI